MCVCAPGRGARAIGGGRSVDKSREYDIAESEGGRE